MLRDDLHDVITVFLRRYANGDIILSDGALALDAKTLVRLIMPIIATSSEVHATRAQVGDMITRARREDQLSLLRFKKETEDHFSSLEQRLRETIRLSIPSDTDFTMEFPGRTFEEAYALRYRVDEEGKPVEEDGFPMMTVSGTDDLNRIEKWLAQLPLNVARAEWVDAAPPTTGAYISLTGYVMFGQLTSDTYTCPDGSVITADDVALEEELLQLGYVKNDAGEWLKQSP